MERRAGSALAAALLVATSAVAAAAQETRSRGTATSGEVQQRDETVWSWKLPPGFPEPVVPDDNPMSAAKVELGRYLFYDPILSLTGQTSCASCHRQELAFTDARAQAVGATGQPHPRSSMSLAGVAYNPSFGWVDPQLRSLEAQASVPLFNRQPIELGVGGSEELVLGRLRDSARYRRMFAASFEAESSPVNLENVRKALASFERTLISGNSPYDRLVFLDERSAMSAAALRGMRLFFSERLGCSGCHFGPNFSGPAVSRDAPHIEALFESNGFDEPGREPKRFRIPTLRNIAVTAPFMHDGRLESLEDVTRHYERAGLVARNPRLRRFSLLEHERAELIAFLESLTDAEFLRDARFADPIAGTQ